MSKQADGCKLQKHACETGREPMWKMHSAPLNAEIKSSTLVISPCTYSTFGSSNAKAGLTSHNTLCEYRIPQRRCQKIGWRRISNCSH